MDPRINWFVATQNIQARMAEASSARSADELARQLPRKPHRHSRLAWLTRRAPAEAAAPARP